MNQIKKMCCIFNYAPHYRRSIYHKLYSELNAEFYFGANLVNGEAIRKLDLTTLCGFQKEFTIYKAGPFKWSWGWLKLAFCKKYDRFLITQDLYAVNQWFFLLACKMLHKSVYVWTHGLRQNPIVSGHKSTTTEFLRQWEDKYIAGYFLYGDRAKENMWLAGYNLDKLHVVYNSLDYDKALALRGKVPSNPYKEIFHNDAPVIVFIGRLTKVKKLEMAVKAVKRLLDRGIEVNMAFLGDGPEKEPLEHIIKNLGNTITEDAVGVGDMIRPRDLDTIKDRIGIKGGHQIKDRYEGHFHFAGSVYDVNAIHSYLYHSSLCLSPGNVGLTAITCLAEGLPVITHDNMDEQMPEVEAITPGITGDLFRQGDLNDLTEKTSLWLDKLCSPEQRDEIRVQCYKVIDQRYNPTYQVKVFKENIYK